MAQALLVCTNEINVYGRPFALSYIFSEAHFKEALDNHCATNGESHREFIYVSVEGDLFWDRLHEGYKWSFCWNGDLGYRVDDHDDFIHDYYLLEEMVEKAKPIHRQRGNINA